MKRLIFFAFYLVVSGSRCFAQQKIVRYCDIVAAPPTKYDSFIRLDYGSDSNLVMHGDSTEMTILKKVTKFDNKMDALDYMASIGWRLIYINVVHFGFDVYYYNFSKEMN